MKPLLTRAFARNAQTATLIVALGLGLAGVTASPALAQAALPGSAARATPAGGSPVIPGGPAQPAPWGPQADLLLTVQASPSAPVEQWTLTCGPDGGTLPDPARACQVLSEVWDPFTPLPRGVMCAMIVYSTHITTITGWWDGVWISVRFSRTFSCQAAQWAQILPLLPPGPGAVNPGGPMLPGPPPPAG